LPASPGSQPLTERAGGDARAFVFSGGFRRIVDAMTEDDLIPLILDAVRAAGAATTAPHVLLGPGADDAAALRAPPDHDLVWTVDDHVEDVHFRAAWGWEAAGRKAVGAALSDLAGKGAAPLGALVSLHLPRRLDTPAILALARGIGAGLAAAGCPLLGGNLVAHPERVAISTSALGAAPSGRTRTRSAARPGDRLVVTGRLGLARAGLRWLEQGRRADEPPGDLAVARLLAPRPRFDVARALARAGDVRVACMDLSDGLARDLPRLLRASGVAAVVDGAALPGPAPELVAALAPGEDPLAAAARLAWAGGEDFELLLAAPEDTLAALALTGAATIGRIEAGAPGALRVEGASLGGAQEGFDHFA
jgi:thiamine-monophosphate kinase